MNSENLIDLQSLGLPGSLGSLLRVRLKTSGNEYVQCGLAVPLAAVAPKGGKFCYVFCRGVIPAPVFVLFSLSAAMCLSASSFDTCSLLHFPLSLSGHSSPSLQKVSQFARFANAVFPDFFPESGFPFFPPLTFQSPFPAPWPPLAVQSPDPRGVFHDPDFSHGLGSA